MAIDIIDATQQIINQRKNELQQCLEQANLCVKIEQWSNAIYWLGKAQAGAYELEAIENAE
jgi:hypothetical protein